ncbi:Translin, partial [Chytridium lagenaria]
MSWMSKPRIAVVRFTFFNKPQVTTRERIVKIQIMSIFTEQTPMPLKPFFLACQNSLDEAKSSRSTLDDASLQEALQKQGDILNLFKKIQKDIEAQDFHRHFRSFAPGLEEYVEACSFMYYLRTGDLIPKHMLDEEFKDRCGFTQPLPLDSYFLGLADLTGELMRGTVSVYLQANVFVGLCIDELAKSRHERARSVCLFVRNLVGSMETVDYAPLKKKIAVVRTNLTKVEKACCNAAIRIKENPNAEARFLVVDEQNREL